MAAPFMMDEKATWNCTAKKAPDEKPETEVSARSMT
jgi:hypothetical protein